MGDKKCVMVLCPTGHRHTVKVNQNTTLLQVLEEACAKQGLDPLDYILRKEDAGPRAKPFDLTLSIRFAGLLNNARLEIAQGERRREAGNAPVTVAFQFPDGERVQDSFTPQTTLWDALQQVNKECPKTPDGEDGKTVVVVYMRDEIIGQASLTRTTLKDIGIISGRAVLRVIYRDISADTVKGIEETVKQNAIQREKAGKETAAKLQQQQASKTSNPRGEQRVDSAMDCSHIPVQDVSDLGYGPQTEVQPIDIDPATMDAEQKEFIRKMAKFIGASLSSEEDANLPDPRKPGPSSAMVKLEESNTVNPGTSAQNVPGEFADFKFPDPVAASGNTQDSRRVEKWPLPVCERNMQVYKISAVENTGSGADAIPDEFFDVNTSDVKKMMQDLTAQRDRLENAPLLTKAQQQAKIDAAVEKYKYSVLRFRFPDGFIVQAHFHPYEKISELVKFVSGVVERDVRFYLYTSPPKVELKKREETLLHYKLFPKAVVYVGISGDRQGSERNILTDDVRAGAVMLGEVRGGEDEVQGEGGQVSQPAAGTSSTSSSSSSTTSAASKSSDATTKDGKVPKWFKVGK